MAGEDVTIWVIVRSEILVESFTHVLVTMPAQSKLISIYEGAFISRLEPVF